MAIDGVNRIELVMGDITKDRADAIVNAANAQLRGGGGVDGAIHRAAGPQLLDACRKIGGCPTGDARITPEFDLPARYVIHAVGPVYRDGRQGEGELLASCYQASLRLAADNGCETAAFAAISCGVYGYPIPDAARIALSTAADFLEEHELPRIARWVLFDSKILGHFQNALNSLTQERSQ